MYHVFNVWSMSGVVKRIIPAVASTNAVIAGLFRSRHSSVVPTVFRGKFCQIPQTCSCSWNSAAHRVKIL